MTAVVIMRFDDGILVASDGAAYTDDGLLHSHVSKVVTMPEWSCVIAGRGMGCALPRMYLMLQNLTSLGRSVCSFDDVLEALPGLAVLLKRQYDENLPGAPHFSFLIGGFSEERQAWESYVLRSREDGAGEAYLEGDQPAFTLIPLPGLHLAPLASDASLFAAGVAMDSEAPANPTEQAIRLICAARLDKGWMERRLNEPARHFIGGFVQVTILGLDTVSSSIVHRWPDPIGEPILPRGELLPAHLRAVDPA